MLEPLQRRSGAEVLTVETHVEDLAHVTPQRMLWVGHSRGAMLALSFATAHPELVQAVMIVGCGTYDEATRRIYRDRFDALLTARGLLAKLGALHARELAALDDATRDRLLLEQGRIASDAETYELCEPNEDVEDTTANEMPDARAPRDLGRRPALATRRHRAGRVRRNPRAGAHASRRPGSPPWPGDARSAAPRHPAARIHRLCALRA